MLYIAGRVVPPPVWYSATFMVSRVFVDSVSAQVLDTTRPSRLHRLPSRLSTSTQARCCVRIAGHCKSGQEHQLVVSLTRALSELFTGQQTLTMTAGANVR